MNSQLLDALKVSSQRYPQSYKSHASSIHVHKGYFPAALDIKYKKLLEAINCFNY